MPYTPGQLVNPQPSIRVLTGAADTPTSVDNGNIVRCTSAAPVSIVFPVSSNEAVALIPGYLVNYVGEGAGLLSFAAGAGDSIYGYGQGGYFNASPHAAAGQGAFITAVLIAQNGSGVRTWALCGALA
ncbi:MAG: hypothetical protein OSA97_01475 [Nevskia sp.]|nr:hypothetical protein [Nevskia sp.]